MTTGKIITSYYSEHLAIEISANYLEFTSVPWYPCFNKFVVEIQNVLGITYIHKTLTRQKCKLDISSLKNGKYFSNIYIADNSVGKTSMALLQDNVMIKVEGGTKSFFLPECIQTNREFIDKIPISKNDLLKYTLSTKSIECHRQEINMLAKEICQFSHNDYNRLLCIHDWIVQNLYYDMDSYNNGEYVINTHKAIDAIKCDKKCVCSDFTYLTIALARALNIPALGITCRTENNRECWDSSLCNEVKSDHIFAAAFVENRWILMDNTWDCNNQILNGVFYKKKQGYDRKYYDVSLEILSSTHQFVDICI